VSLEPGERGQLVAQYREGVDAVEAALEGVTEAELDHRPGPGEWTIREVVHHLADSEMTSAIRIRRLLAEDQPTLQGYDQEEFVRRLHYADRPIGSALSAIRAARETTAEILDLMTPADWQRKGTHTESGEYHVEGWLRIYSRHCHDHADQIRRARTAPVGQA
jgi:hypothetical protein